MAAPDFTQLPTEKKEDPHNKQAKVAGPASVAVAVASAAVAQELDRKVEASQLWRCGCPCVAGGRIQEEGTGIWVLLFLG